MTSDGPDGWRSCRQCSFSSRAMSCGTAPVIIAMSASCRLFMMFYPVRHRSSARSTYFPRCSPHSALRSTEWKLILSQLASLFCFTSDFTPACRVKIAMASILGTSFKSPQPMRHVKSHSHHPPPRRLQIQLRKTIRPRRIAVNQHSCLVLLLFGPVLCRFKGYSGFIFLSRLLRLLSLLSSALSTRHFRSARFCRRSELSSILWEVKTSL